MSKTPFFIVNPCSAGGRLGRVWKQMIPKIEAALGPFEFALTKAPKDATAIAARAARAGHPLIVAVGGDGTNLEVLNGLLEDDKLLQPDVVMGVLPFGTGGDFRRMLGGEDSIDGAIARLRRGNDRRIDVGRVDFQTLEGGRGMRYFINVASLGISGLIDRRVNESKKPFGGKVAFIAALLRSLAEYKAPLVEFQIDEGPWTTCPIFNIAAANGQFFGAGMHIAPDAILDDGLFDIVTVQPAPLRQLLLRPLDLHRGHHIRRPWVDVRRGACLRTRSDAEVWLDVDGETPGILPATFQILKGVLSLRMD